MAVRIIPFTVISHVVYVNDKDVFGPGHAVEEFLTKKRLNHIYIKHSLFDVRKSEVKRGNKTTKIKWTGHIPAPFKYFQESITTLFYLRSNPTKVIIAADPLNAITGIVAKHFGYTNNTIFYTVDYAQNRFSNSIFNHVYHMLDRIARNNSDKVWNVSTRIQTIRSEQGLSKERNRLVPNTPILSKLKKFRTKQAPYSMVIMANFTPAIDYNSILKATKRLSLKWKNFNLTLIGAGEKEKKVKNLVKKMNLEENVTFAGFLPHEKALKEAAKSKIGLAPYKKAWPWTEYGDSLKAREYLALGLPVIISDIVSTSDDIKDSKAGCSIKMSVTTLSQAVEKILKDYKNYQKNAEKLAANFDLEKILNKELKEYL